MNKAFKSGARKFWRMHAIAKTCGTTMAAVIESFEHHNLLKQADKYARITVYKTEAMDYSGDTLFHGPGFLVPTEHYSKRGKLMSHGTEVITLPYIRDNMPFLLERAENMVGIHDAK